MHISADLNPAILDAEEPDISYFVEERFHFLILVPEPSPLADKSAHRRGARKGQLTRAGCEIPRPAAMVRRLAENLSQSESSAALPSRARSISAA